jgi:hypothetical protein
MRLPIFFSSTHGVYEVNRDMRPFTVPEGVYIIETATVGEYCLTGIDPPLWELMQPSNRPFFNRLLGGNFSSKNKYDDQWIEVLHNIILYQPGDSIYPRNLSIGGGKGERRAYPTMGFYQFNYPGTDYPIPEGSSAARGRIPLLEPLRDKLMANKDLSITTNDFIMGGSRGVPSGLYDIFHRITPGIYIFSCCGEARKGRDITDAEFNKLLYNIEHLQQQQQLKNLSMYENGLPSYSKDPELKRKRQELKHRYNLRVKNSDEGFVKTAYEPPRSRMYMASDEAIANLARVGSDRNRGSGGRSARKGGRRIRRKYTRKQRARRIYTHKQRV